VTPRHLASLVAAVGPRGSFPSLELPEVALAGRSNVGKSSLINCLAGRRRLAPISSDPGKTKTIRFYTVDDSLTLVDLPGYGYAKVPRTLRNAWKRLVERYFAERPALVAVLQVVDIRHPGLKNDTILWDWLSAVAADRLVVATKADKVSRNQRAGLRAAVRDAFGVKENEVIVFSAVTGEGRDDLWRWILAKRDSTSFRESRRNPGSAAVEREYRTVPATSRAKSPGRRRGSCRQHAGRTPRSETESVERSAVGRSRPVTEEML
jgi:GTP-binding protein